MILPLSTTEKNDSDRQQRPLSYTYSLVSVGSITGGVIGFVSYWIVWGITTIASFVMIAETYFVGIMLQLSGNIVNMFAVTTGYSVALAITNLGFVLAIIIIAVATILNNKTFGMNTMLPKLIMAAILVNFSLVIGGAIINFSNTLTDSFLNKLPGATVNSPGAMTFAQELTGAFEPQRAFILSPDSQVHSWGAQVENGTGNDFSSFIGPLIGIISAAALMIIMVIVLGVFIIMLLIRYVYLAMLLIVMPFVWLLWIFPATKSHFRNWWDKFIKWSFFAPIVVFFLWLAIATAQAMAGNSQGSPIAFTNGSAFAPQANSPVLQGVSSVFGSMVGQIISFMLQGVLIAGLALGGIYAAEKLSIKGAKLGVGAASAVGTAIGSYAGNKGKKVGRFAAHKSGAVNVVDKMRQSRIPGIGTLGRKIMPQLNNADLVEGAKIDIPKDKTEWEKNLKGLRKKEHILKYLATGAEKGWLSKNTQVGGTTAGEYMDKNGDVFIQRYGQGKTVKDADKAMGGNKEMRDAQRAMEGLTKGTKEYEDALKVLEEKTATFAKTLSKSDAAKMNVNEIFKEDTPESQAWHNALAKHVPQFTSTITSKLSPENFEKFGPTHNAKLDQIKSDLEPAYLTEKKSIEKDIASKRVAHEIKLRELNEWKPANQAERMEREAHIENEKIEMRKIDDEFKSRIKDLDEGTDIGRAYNKIISTKSSFGRSMINNVTSVERATGGGGGGAPGGGTPGGGHP